MSFPHQALKELLLKAGEAVALRVQRSLKEQTVEQLSSIAKRDVADTIFSIDRDVEEILVPIIEAGAEKVGGIVLIAEGIGNDLHGEVFPRSFSAEQAAVRIIMDPIDGTRGIMYDKRSAFFLAGAAPNRGTETRLSDIEVAVMTELPNSKSVLSDNFSAIKGQGVEGFTLNLETGSKRSKTARPSQAETIIGGFAQLARFFPPGRAILAAIEDELIESILAENPEHTMMIFEDQYISTGGQLYEVLVGHDRFIGDIRPLVYRHLEAKGKKAGHMCHPYDCAAFLIGQEAGLIITNEVGQAFDAPLNVTENVGWLLFANPHIFQQVWPRLQKLYTKYQLA